MIFKFEEKLAIITWHLNRDGTFVIKDDEVFEEEISNVEIKDVLSWSNIKICNSYPI